MNNYDLGAKKLEQLLEMAKTAENDFERAAVFAATAMLDRMFRDANDPELGDGALGYPAGKARSACRWINAIVGYDISNGKSIEECASFALSDISTLRSALREREREEA